MSYQALAVAVFDLELPGVDPRPVTRWRDLPLAERIWRVGYAVGWPFLLVAALFGLAGNVGAFKALSMAGVLVVIPSLLTAFALERRMRRTRERARASDND